jgi:arsenate reductase
VAVTIYHNPRCSKSRTTLKLLRDQDVQPEIIEYLKSPPNEAQLRELIDLLGISPRELLRKGEDAYKELGLKDKSLSDDTLIQAMLDHPKLIERPIVVANGKAVLGRPPENVLDLI